MRILILKLILIAHKFGDDLQAQQTAVERKRSYRQSHVEKHNNHNAGGLEDNYRDTPPNLWWHDFNAACKWRYNWFA